MTVNTRWIADEPVSDSTETRTVLPTVIGAVGAVMRDVQAIRKKDRNRHFGFQFRGVDAVVNAVGPALREHGVVIVPTAVEPQYGQVTTAGGKASQQAVLKVTFTVYGPAGDAIALQTVGEAWDEGDKGTSKAHSVAYRIALLQLLCIPTDEPDPDHDSYQRATVKMASAEAVAELRRRIDALDDDTSRDLRSWWMSNKVTPLSRLTDADAVRVSGWLTERGAPAPDTTSAPGGDDGEPD